MCGFRFELWYERRTMYYGGAVAAAAQTWKQVVQQIHNNTVDCIIALTALLRLVVAFFLQLIPTLQCSSCLYLLLAVTGS